MSHFVKSKCTYARVVGDLDDALLGGVADDVQTLLGGNALGHLVTTKNKRGAGQG